jgi:very-short-patch-repair endonuclease
MKLIPTSKPEIDWQRYVTRQTLFDHPSEFEFYKILRDEILGTKFVALIQVPIARFVDVSGVKAGMRFDPLRTKIDKKSVDFLVCHKEDLRPGVAIELDGSSHWSAKRKERDKFVEELLDRVGFPLLRFTAARTYDKRSIAEQIAKPLGLVWKRKS